MHYSSTNNNNNSSRTAGSTCCRDAEHAFFHKDHKSASRERANRLSQAFFEFWTMLSNVLAACGFGESISIEKYLPGCCLFSLTSDGCVDIWLAAKAENWVPNSACWVFTYTSAVGLFLTLLVNNISQWNLFGSPLCSYSIQKYSSLFTLVLVFASLKRSLFIALRLSAAPEKYDWDIYVYIVHIHSLTFEINEHSSTPIRHLFSLVVRAGDVPRPNSIQLGS